MSAQRPGAQANDSRKPVRTANRADGLGMRRKDLDAFRKMPPLEQRDHIRAGLAALVVDRIAQELFQIPTRKLLNTLGLSSSAIVRKIEKGAKLSSVESDRVVRAIYVFDRAVDAFEDKELAAEWMLRPHALLACQCPLQVLDSQPGYDRVCDLLMQITFCLSV